MRRSSLPRRYPKSERPVAETTGDRTRVRIEQQLGGVVAQPFVGRVAAVNTESVTLAGADIGDVSVPDEVGPLDERMRRELGSSLVEENEVDRLSALREDREVGARTVPGCAEWGVGSRPRGTATGRASGGGELWNSHDSTRLADLGLPT